MSSQAEVPNWVYGAKSSFAAGELTPTIEGRADLPLYQNGAKKIINWMILPSGGLTRRPGTEFIWGVQGADDALASKSGKTGSHSDTEESGTDAFGSSVSVSISSDSEDDLPPIHPIEGLTFVPTAQDPTSRLYRDKTKRDEGERYFDYGILDEEDKAYRESIITSALEKKQGEKQKGKDKEKQKAKPEGKAKGKKG